MLFRPWRTITAFNAQRIALPATDAHGARSKVPPARRGNTPNLSRMVSPILTGWL